MDHNLVYPIQFQSLLISLDLHNIVFKSEVRKQYSWSVSFFFVKGPAADATDAPQPWGLLRNPVMKMISFFRSFL
jgi:hypothetical protein